ncbi:energy-coupling factor transporter ATPase [Caldicellulosiruptoraceae bacterium PP1]
MLIEIKDVDFYYGYKTPLEKKALSNINIKIDSGEFIGIIGKTGSGKSTLVQLMNGLLIPQKGDVLVEGLSTKDKNKLKEIRRKVGLVFQYPEYQLFEETVYKDIAFGPNNLGMPREEIERIIKELINLLEIPEELLERSPFELSGGQKRRVALAGILSMDPSVIILDEPTAGLDVRGKKRIFDLIQKLHVEKKKTVIMISHSIEDIAMLCDRVIILSKGQIKFDGSKKECFNNFKILEEAGLSAPDILVLQERLKEKGFDIGEFEYRVEDVAEKILEQFDILPNK